MKISIKATNIELTDAIRLKVEQKIGELEKYIQKTEDLDKAVKGRAAYEVWVEVGRTTRHHKKGIIFRAEAQMRLRGKSLRAESENLDLYQAIDEVHDELKVELSKHKEKMISKRKRASQESF